MVIFCSSWLQYTMFLWTPSALKVAMLTCLALWVAGFWLKKTSPLGCPLQLRGYFVGYLLCCCELQCCQLLVFSASSALAVLASPVMAFVGFVAADYCIGMAVSCFTSSDCCIVMAVSCSTSSVKSMYIHCRSMGWCWGCGMW